jgi:hypothetical protein
MIRHASVGWRLSCIENHFGFGEAGGSLVVLKAKIAILE